MNETWTCVSDNPFYISSSTATVSSTCSVAPSSSVLTAAGFTYGEVVISIELLLILLAVSYTFLFNWAHGIKIAKQR